MMINVNDNRGYTFVQPWVSDYDGLSLNARSPPLYVTPCSQHVTTPHLLRGALEHYSPHLPVWCLHPYHHQQPPPPYTPYPLPGLILLIATFLHDHTLNLFRVFPQVLLLCAEFFLSIPTVYIILNIHWAGCRSKSSSSSSIPDHPLKHTHTLAHAHTDTHTHLWPTARAHLRG